MNAGKLRHRVVLQQPADPSPRLNTHGEVIQSWSTVATVWASIEAATESVVFGFESTVSAQTRSEVDVKITIRYSSDVSGIDATWRATHAGKSYAIKAVMSEELQRRPNQTIVLFCKQGIQDS